jgi:NADH oxidase (H2O-forming)
MSTKVLKVTDSVSWIGIRDWDIRTFDIVMTTEYGTTYNSYFIDAEKKAIIETAKEKFSDEYLEKVREVCNPEDIEYVVLNHTEPDHSGSLAKLLEIAPNAKVVASGQAIKYLQEIHDKKFEYIIVKDGDELDLGNKKLKIIGAPNLHWPDSIYTYLEDEKVLFTCDSFGAHYCSEEMFDDLLPNYDDSFKYYFDVILKPFSKFMLRAIEKIKPLEIDIIATGHGPILRKHHQRIIDLTEKYSEEYLADNEHEKKKVLITYVSAYGYTANMAESIANGIKKAGDIEVEICDIENIELGELDSKLVSADALMIGSPTINQNILLPVYKLFALVNPIRDRFKLAAAFGSYGWSGEGVAIIEAVMRTLKLKVFEDSAAVKFRPDTNQSEELEGFGKCFGDKLLGE